MSLRTPICDLFGIEHPVFLAGDEFHLMFSKKSVSESLVAEIDEVLARMEADGRLRQIMDKYIKK